MITSTKKIDLLESMLLVRRFEEKLTEMSRAGERIAGMVILCTGQEAVAAGVCRALEPEDVIISNHRSHGHLLAKGAPPGPVMAEILGRRTGCNKGKSGTLHIAVPEVNALCTTTVVGGGIPIAVGTAFAAQYQRRPVVTTCFFGDGAADEGSFHEALNLAALWHLPVIFVCENNAWAGAQRHEEHTLVQDIATRALGYGMTGHVVDGNDAVAVYEATREARRRCLEGKGPVLLEMKTYRWRGHSEFDRQLYQPKEEIAAWMERCPIKLLQEALLAEGVLTYAVVAEMEDRARRTVEEAVAFAMNSPWPEPEEALENVFCD
ncbi:MAG: thiamine pyrophosphate-dependent dehydrogenase E1 component subunit alpha [Thermoanaerobacterales bacterium]|nr:thiamine pyrophosphate-dependent dehydrogenase E1 component subunit alpha [Thermoanaerobacterales bacterium]